MSKKPGHPLIGQMRQMLRVGNRHVATRPHCVPYLTFFLSNDCHLFLIEQNFGRVDSEERRMFIISFIFMFIENLTIFAGETIIRFFCIILMRAFVNIGLIFRPVIGDGHGPSHIPIFCILFIIPFIKSK